MIDWQDTKTWRGNAEKPAGCRYRRVNSDRDLAAALSVMATTDGRTGMSGLKSGQRVDRSRSRSGPQAPSPRRRRPDAARRRTASGRRAQTGAAHFGADRHAEEPFRGRACRPFGVDRPQAVGAAGASVGPCRRWRPTAAPSNRPRNCRACRTSHPWWSWRRWRRSATDGSPHFNSTSHLPLRAGWSPSAPSISMMWP